MAEHPSLEAAVASHPRCRRIGAGLFTRLQYIPESEEVHMGWCCFAASTDELLSALATGRPEALLTLARALDDDGNPTASTTRLDIIRTPSGRLVGFQPVKYEGWSPSPGGAARLFEGADAAVWHGLLETLDQCPRPEAESAE